MMPGNMKKDPPPPVHVPIEPIGMNSQGSMHFSQGLLPGSCWLVVPVSPMSHPQVPVPQIQVMNSMDYLKIIDIACADMSYTAKLKFNNRKQHPQQQQQHNSTETTQTREFMNQMKEKYEREAYTRSLAMLNNSGAPSPSISVSPVSMSPRASNDR